MSKKKRTSGHYDQIIKFKRHTGANADLLNDSKRADIMEMTYGKYMAWKRENKMILGGNLK